MPLPPTMNANRGLNSYFIYSTRLYMLLHFTQWTKYFFAQCKDTKYI